MMKRTSSRRRAGAAYTEALIMLPVFFAVFAGIHLFHDGYSAKMLSMNEGRMESWRIVNDYDNCGNDSTLGPPADGEAGPPSGVVPDDVEAEGTDSTSGVSDSLGSAGSEDTSGSGAGSTLNGLISGAVGALFGKSHETNASRTFERSAYFGGSSGRSSAKYWTICNPEPKTIGELIVGMFCNVVESASGWNPC